MRIRVTNTTAARFGALMGALLALFGCADSGPIKIAKDTYSLSVRVALSGPAGAKGDALKEATRTCAGQGKEVLLQTETSQECALHGGCGEAEITFLCVSDDDPRYQQQHQLRKDNGVTTIESK
jgi:hypothetical protein